MPTTQPASKSRPRPKAAPRTKPADPLTARYGTGKGRYLELIMLHPLKRVESDAELEHAIAVIDSLVPRDLSLAEQDYLDVLSDLVERYEEKEIPIPPAPDREMLRILIDGKRVAQADVAKAVGIAESTVSEVLRGKRKLTRTQVGKVARYFKVSPAVFAFDGHPKGKAK